MKKTCLKKNFNLKKKKGVTLVELIVVLAIIAVLAIAMIPQFSGYITEAKKVSALDEAREIVMAYESIKHTSNLTTSATIDQIATASNGLLDADSITKLSGSLTYSDCLAMLTSEDYDFTFDDNGVIISPPSASS